MLYIINRLGFATGQHNATASEQMHSGRLP